MCIITLGAFQDDDGIYHCQLMDENQTPLVLPEGVGNTEADSIKDWIVNIGVIIDQWQSELRYVSFLRSCAKSKNKDFDDTETLKYMDSKIAVLEAVIGVYEKAIDKIHLAGSEEE